MMLVLIIASLVTESLVQVISGHKQCEEFDGVQ